MALEQRAPDPGARPAAGRRRGRDVLAHRHGQGRAPVADGRPGRRDRRLRTGQAGQRQRHPLRRARRGLPGARPAGLRRQARPDHRRRRLGRRLGPGPRADRLAGDADPPTRRFPRPRLVGQRPDTSRRSTSRCSTSCGSCRGTSTSSAPSSSTTARKPRRRYPMDEVILALGFKADLGPIREWGLETIGRRYVKVNNQHGDQPARRVRRRRRRPAGRRDAAQPHRHRLRAGHGGGQLRLHRRPARRQGLPRPLERTLASL